MKIIRNKYLPIKGFMCMNVLGLLFVREEVVLDDEILNHEGIHTAQQYEIVAISAMIAVALSTYYASWWYLLAILVQPILLYVLAWLIAVILPPYDSAYYDSPFEREAYANEHDPLYLAKRPWLAWVMYIFKKRK